MGRNLGEFVSDIFEPVMVYQFEQGDQKKYSLVAKGDFEKYPWFNLYKTQILKDEGVKFSEDYSFKRIPVSIAKKMDFLNFDFAYSQIVQEKIRISLVLLTPQQKKLKEKELLSNFGEGGGDFTYG